MKKRIFSILLTLCMLLCIMPTAAFAEAAPTGTALTQENISNYKQEKTSTYSENGVYLPIGSYYLAEDIYLVGDDADPNSAWPLIISEGDVTLDLNGHVLDLKKKNISIYSNGNLTLTDSDPDAKHKFRVEDSGLWVWDEMQGTETLTGGVITGGTSAADGQFGNLGGGVYMSGGSFTMEGGSIVGCTANNGGGVSVSYGSFTMNGGSITGCTAVKSGQNYGSGGGVRVDENSHFTMTGGSIEDCTAADAGGGVRVDENSHFTMEGGSIVGCTANYGGGVDASGNSFTMKDGSITDCTANNGGGVNFGNNSFTMEGGSITDCTANNGGGIYVQPNSMCELTMAGGSITNCTAAYAGGGVFVCRNYQSGSFTMAGGSITNCTAGGADNAVHADGNFTDNSTNKIDKSLVSGINAGHTGTSTDPILIGSAEGLKDFRDKVNGGQTELCAKLLCDIELNRGTFDENGTWSEGGAAESWAPICTDTNPYTGTFDGGGKTIKGLYVNVNGDYFAGLFGCTEDATIKNVTVDGYVSISGNFSNNGDTANVAGIVACAMNTSIADCTNLCTVKSDSSATAGSFAGGIVGNMYCTGNTECSITNCRNGGKVIRIANDNSEFWIGGIAGVASVPVSGCYNTGSITANCSDTKYASSSVGGIAGECSMGTISSCYNVGKVIYTGNCEQVNSGGIVGINAISTVTDCYYLTGTAEKAVGLEHISATTERAEVKSKAEFTDGTVLNLLKGDRTDSPWTKCGYLNAAGMTLPLLSWQTADAHICTPENPSQWECDESGHWQVCSCGFSVNKGNHSGTDDGNCTTEVSCDKCSYVIKLAQTEHNWSDWEHLTTTHTRKCNNPGCSATDTKNCLDENKDHKCDTCEAVMSQCADNNNDHKCEICNKVISNHDDADGDHICDVCNKAISNHNDADSDHICDICNKAISNHNDTNSDHICDICNKVISNHDDADGDHICDICDKVISNHTGGTATCTAKAKCEVCGEKYGYLKPHSYSADWVTDETSHWHECTECGAKTDEAEHIDADKDHKCDLCGKTLSEHSGGTATCKDKAQCKVCGESYGELDSNNHADMKHIEAKAATKTDEGNIEYWYCEDCDKYFADKDENKEITKADTVTAKLPEEKPTSPKTGDTSNLALWIALLFISGGAVTGATVAGKKKKQQG